MKKVIMFSGQGTQYPKMFIDLVKEYSIVNKVFKNASKIADIDLIELCRKGDNDELSKTEYSQPVILACNIAAWELVKQHSFNTDYFAGYSLGEYAALYAAGCLGFEDVFRVIKVRAGAMQKAMPIGSGGMAAVIFDNEQTVLKYFENKEDVWISNINTCGQFSISGKIEAVERACAELKELGVITKQIPVSVPFHCPLLNEVTIKIEEVLKTIEISNARIPIIMNVDGALETQANQIRRKIIEQAVKPVQWIKTLNYLYENKVNIYIECGPGHTLSNFVRRMRFPECATYNIENIKGFQNLRRDLCLGEE